MVTKRNKTKTLLVVGLLLAVAGLTLGFAAFSNTLTISSSATVTPDASTFSVQFSASETEILVGEENPMFFLFGTLYKDKPCGIIDVNNQTISNLSINVPSSSGLTYCDAYVHNTGEYDAYLNEIVFNNVAGTDSKRKCTAIETGDETRATDSLVEAACEGEGAVYLRVVVNGTEKTENATETTEVSGHKLEKGAVEKIRFIFNTKTINYPVDGPYTIDFGDIELKYSTVDVNAS